MSDSITIMNTYLKRKHLSVDIEGKCYRFITLTDYKTYILKIMSLMIIGFIIYLFRKIPYHDITVIGNTIYSQIISSTLDQFNIPYVRCKESIKQTYYETEQGDEIPFEGVSTNSFIKNLEHTAIPVIPNNNVALLLLETHLNKSIPHPINITSVQESILSKFDQKDDVYFWSPKFWTKSPSNIYKSHITNITRISNDLFYIVSEEDAWITRIILNDVTWSLQPGDSISSLYGDVYVETNEKYSIFLPYIYEPTTTTILTRDISYYMNSDFTIKHIGEHKGIESNIWSLQQPRLLSMNNIYTIHPFHLPPSWDPFLSIMIATLAIVK